MVQVFTAAHGKKYHDMARDMANSFIEHGWPSLTVITNSFIKNYPARQIIAPSNMVGGRELKTKFGLFAKPSTESVVFVDCDCLAEGPPEIPNLPEGHISGRFLTEIPTPIGSLPFLASTVLVMGGSHVAKAICERWYAEHLKREKGSSDEHALFGATLNTPKIDLGGSYKTPLKNLRHLGVTSAERNANRVQGAWVERDDSSPQMSLDKTLV
jgi:hypothetical protein